MCGPRSRGSAPITAPPTRHWSTTSPTWPAAKEATPGQVALAWLLAQQPWIVPIPGTRRIERVRENAGGTAVALSADDVADLNAVAARIGVAGDRYNEQHMALVEH